MVLIKLDKVSRKYQIKKDKDFYAVKNISLMFEEKGFVSIIGKSGSGKSTILNLIARLDKPTGGNIYYKDKNLVNLSPKEITNYYKADIGILFQNYNLMLDQTALFNAELPLLINGVYKFDAHKKAAELLEYAGLDKSKHNLLASKLSGGEAQRVALVRTIINEPDVVLADEPTGALDSKNSLRVMNILKEYSANHLVIMVSHNNELVKQYSDRIIEVKSGTIVRDSNKLLNSNSSIIKKKKCAKSTSWISSISWSNFKQRFKRNLLSFGALIISLTTCLITIGFIFGKDISISEACKKQLDYGSGTIGLTEKVTNNGILNISRTTRPDIKDLQIDGKIQQNFIISQNFDALLPQKIPMTFNNENIDNIMYSPIYSFDDKYCNHDLLVKGTFPEDSLTNVVINEAALSVLKDKTNMEVINNYISINQYLISSYIDYDNTYINDEFIFETQVKITGVVKELNYLQTPKIYYSYLALIEHLENYIMPNLSTYLGEDISWYNRIENVDGHNMLSSYSYRLFYLPYNQTFSDSLIDEKYSYSAPSIIIANSLSSFMEVAEYGLIVFLIITIVGSILIMGVLSFASYSEDHKKSAVLTCLGANNDEISDIYLNESVLVSTISVVLSLGASYLLSNLINNLIFNLVELKNLISIPFSSYFGIPLFFPLVLVVGGILVAALATLIPISFSKKIVLKEELQSL